MSLYPAVSIVLTPVKTVVKGLAVIHVMTHVKTPTPVMAVVLIALAAVPQLAQAIVPQTVLLDVQAHVKPDVAITVRGVVNHLAQVLAKQDVLADVLVDAMIGVQYLAKMAAKVHAMVVVHQIAMVAALLPVL